MKPKDCDAGKKTRKNKTRLSQDNNPLIYKRFIKSTKITLESTKKFKKKNLRNFTNKKLNCLEGYNHILKAVRRH